jgi:hypothetical protein
MSADTISLSKPDFDAQLDQALKDSFPASDPVSIGKPSSTGPDRPLNRRPAALDIDLVNELARNVKTAREVSLATSDAKADREASRRSAVTAFEDRPQSVSTPAVRNRSSGNTEQRALSNAVSALDGRD